MLERLSAVIIVRNGIRTLGRTLDSLAALGEVVVFDNGSDDGTQDVARGYANVSLHEGEFDGFGRTMNRAIALARNDWVLCVNADEVVPPPLLEELSRLEPSSDTVYALLRHNHFMGRRVRFAGWGGDWLVRLFHRETTRYTDAAVHESVMVPPGVRSQRLRQPFIHYAVEDLGQFLEKVNRYSGIRMRTSNRTYPPVVILLRAAFAFFRTYVLQLGLLEGWRGLVIAWSNANGVFFKYMRIYAKRRT